MNHSTEWTEIKVKMAGKWEPAKAITPYRVEVVTPERVKDNDRLKVGTYVYAYSPNWGYRWIMSTQIKWVGEVPDEVAAPVIQVKVNKQASPRPPQKQTAAVPPMGSKSGSKPKAKRRKPPQVKKKPAVVAPDQKIAKPDPTTNDDLLLEALQLLDAQKYKDAVRLFVAVLANSPESAQQIVCDLSLQQCKKALPAKDWRMVFNKAVKKAA